MAGAAFSIHTPPHPDWQFTIFVLHNSSTPQWKKSHVQQKSSVLVTGILVGDEDTGVFVGVSVTGALVGDVETGVFVGASVSNIPHSVQPLHFSQVHFLFQSVSLSEHQLLHINGLAVGTSDGCTAGLLTGATEGGGGVGALIGASVGGFLHSSHLHLFSYSIIFLQLLSGCPTHSGVLSPGRTVHISHGAEVGDIVGASCNVEPISPMAAFVNITCPSG